MTDRSDRPVGSNEVFEALKQIRETINFLAREWPDARDRIAAEPSFRVLNGDFDFDAGVFDSDEYTSADTLASVLRDAKEVARYAAWLAEMIEGLSDEDLNRLPE